MAPGNRKSPQLVASESATRSWSSCAEFPDDDACLATSGAPGSPPTASTPTARGASEARLQALRDEAAAPGLDVHRLRLHIHPTAGTIFHKSSTSLHLWFYAIYLMTSTRCGVSAKQLERELGVTYKTAWRMFTLIRNQLMVPGRDDRSRARSRWTRPTSVASPVAKGRSPRRVDTRGRRVKCPTRRRHRCSGMVERRGRVRLMSSRGGGQSTLKRLVGSARCSRTRSSTQTSPWLPRLEAERHDRSTTTPGVRARHVHTQTIEGFWSLVKRGISGHITPSPPK